MNFEITNELLETIRPFIQNANIMISNEHKDWKGRDYKSDIVTIDEKNNVRFEVYDNEIIVFYFTSHQHFEDYSFDLENNDDYLKRAKEFLVELFENEIKYVEKYKGRKILTEEYYFVYSKNEEESISGTIFSGLLRFLNPFVKKKESTTIYKFNTSKGCFYIKQVY